MLPKAEKGRGFLSYERKPMPYRCDVRGGGLGTDCEGGGGYYGC